LVPGKDAEVQALLTPGDKSLAGDYMTTISAASRGEAASSQFRITVVTSTVWGMAGAGVIGVALLLMARRLATIPGVSMLRLFTVDRAPLPSFVAILAFLIPLMAIGLGFDAVNSEHSRRTLSRILAQPIYRDALLIGKFLAGLATLAVSLAALWLLVIGLGLIFLGVPPGGEEMSRSLAFLMVAICYAGVWLSLAMLLSIVFRSSSTSALVALGIWLFLTVLWPILAQAIAPPDPRYELLGLSSPDTAIWTQILGRLSPNDLFGEAMLAVLSPSTRALGPVFLDQLRGAVMGSPLPLEESLIIAWPQTVALIAVAILLFAAGYVVFQRQEIRA
jgi:ABC-2 type transport system permease protein